MTFRIRNLCPQFLPEDICVAPGFGNVGPQRFGRGADNSLNLYQRFLIHIGSVRKLWKSRMLHVQSQRSQHPATFMQRLKYIHFMFHISPNCWSPTQNSEPITQNSLHCPILIPHFAWEVRRPIQNPEPRTSLQGDSHQTVHLRHPGRQYDHRDISRGSQLVRLERQRPGTAREHPAVRLLPPAAATTRHPAHEKSDG